MGNGKTLVNLTSTALRVNMQQHAGRFWSTITEQYVYPVFLIQLLHLASKVPLSTTVYYCNYFLNINKETHVLKKSKGCRDVTGLHIQGGSDNTAPFPYNYFYISI